MRRFGQFRLLRFRMHSGQGAITDAGWPVLTNSPERLLFVPGFQEAFSRQCRGWY